MSFTKVTNTGIGSTGTVLLQNLDVIGIATAGFGVSTVDVFTTGITSFANATDSTSTTTGSVIVSGGVGIAGSLNVGGSVSVGGTLTYEDVTNVDSVGLITARGGVFISAGSSIGIGSATPTAPIEVHSSNSTLGIFSGTSSGSNLTLFNNDTQNKIRTVAGRLHLSADVGDAVADSEIRFLVDSNIVARISAGSTLSLGSNTDNQISTPADDTLALRTADSERLRITSAGKVGVGTEEPSGLLHISSTGVTDFVIEADSNNSNEAFNPRIIFKQDGHAAQSAIAIGGTVYDANIDNALTIRNSVSSSGGIIFMTNNQNGSLTPYQNHLEAVERLRISSVGYVTGNINVPAWFGRQDSTQQVGTGAWTTIVNLGNYAVNPSMNNGGWNESNGIFTVQSGQAGTYYVYGQAAIDDVQDNDVVRAGFSKNDGTVPLYSQTRCLDQGSNVIVNSGLIAQTVELAVGDTIKLQVYHNEGNTQPTEAIYTFFGGYRIAV